MKRSSSSCLLWLPFLFKGIIFVLFVANSLCCDLPDAEKTPTECAARKRSTLSGFNLGLITVSLEGERATAYGLKGAAPAGGSFLFAEQEAIARNDGSFQVSFTAKKGDKVSLKLQNEEFVADFLVLEAKTLQKCFLGASVAVGQTANHVRLTRCDGQPVALVAASADALVQRLFLDGRAAKEDTFFAPENNIGAGPYQLHIQGERAVVSLFGAHEIALISTCDGKILARSQKTENLIIDLPDNIELNAPTDVLFDGISTTMPTQMRLRHPQGVVLLEDGTLIAAFTNLLQPAVRTSEKQILGPSVLVRYQVEQEVLRPIAHIILDVENVQSLTLAAQNLLVASASGALQIGENGIEAPKEQGSLLFLNPKNLEFKAQLDLLGFAPATPFVDVKKQRLLIGSFLRAEIKSFQFDDNFIFLAQEERVFNALPNALDSIFELVSFPGDLILIPQFNGDKIFAVQNEGLMPFNIPGIFPIDVSGGTAALRGPLSISTVQHENGSTDAAVLLTFSSEVKPLYFNRVFGAVP